MVRAAIVIIFMLIHALVILTAAKRTALHDALNAQIRDNTVRQLATAVNNYRTENGTYPADLATLFGATGYEHLRSVQRPFQGLAIANNISDGSFFFNRVVVFSQEDFNPTQTVSDFLTTNACGAAPFATAPEWCAPANSETRWWKQESREVIADEIEVERHRLLRLLHKFNAWYNGDVTVSTTNGVWGNNYPNPGSPYANLVALTGFAQTAKTCSGILTWSRIPIDCTDLYSIWGTPTVYNYVSPTHIVLLTKTPFTKADGTPLYVSTEESL